MHDCALCVGSAIKIPGNHNSIDGTCLKNMEFSYRTCIANLIQSLHFVRPGVKCTYVCNSERFFNPLDDLCYIDLICICAAFHIVYIVYIQYYLGMYIHIYL